jgi:hypothetical protein
MQPTLAFGATLLMLHVMRPRHLPWEPWKVQGRRISLAFSCMTHGRPGEQFHK